MARESLQRELQRYLKISATKGREELAKKFQQEIIVHVDDYIDALFIEYQAQHGLDAKEKDRRTSEGRDLKKAFKEGGKVIVDRLYDKIGGMRKSDGVTTYPDDVLQIRKFDNDKGIVIYMLNQHEFNWQTNKFTDALIEAKRMGLDAVNEELAKIKKKQVYGYTLSTVASTYVTLSYKGRLKAAEVIAYDMTADVCLLKVKDVQIVLILNL